jgi:drug/metabolite transporter superfamily protein YnfA
MRGYGFGVGLAADGDTAVVLAGYEVGSEVSLHVHERVHGSWQWKETVGVPTQWVPEEWLPTGPRRPLAIDGDWVALIGERVHLFRRESGAWAHAQILDVLEQDSVVLSGSTLVLASHVGKTARVFELRSGVWTFLEQFQGGQIVEEFGYATAMDDTWLVIGSPKASWAWPDDIGHAFVYRRTVDAAGKLHWSFVQLLTGLPSDGFGRAVAIHGDTLVVGAPGQFDTGSPYMDKVHVYRLGATGTWNHFQTLRGTQNGSGAGPKTQFGCALALSGNDLLVGSNWYSPSATLQLTGAAFHYRFNGSSWLEVVKWLPKTSGKYDVSGSMVAIAGSSALVAAPYRDTACRGLQPDCDAGAVWVQPLLP